MKRKHIIDGKEYEIEIPDEEIIDGLDTSNKSILDRILEKIGAKPAEKKEAKSEAAEKTEATLKTDNISEAIAKALEPLTESLKDINDKVKDLQEGRETERKTKAEQKRDEIIQKALSDGRIAKGEVGEWTKKFDKKYHSDLEVFEEVITLRAPDEKIKRENQTAAGNRGQEKRENNSSQQASAGSPSFKREDLKDPAFFAKHRDEIAEAERQGNIID